MVQTTAYDPNQAAYDPYAMLEGGGKSIRFAQKDANGRDIHDPVGTSYTGIITGELRTARQTNFTTKQPESWPDGRPKMQVVVDLLTEYRDDQHDDGVRSLYVKNQMLAAFQEAVKANQHLGRPGAGTRVTVTLIEEKNVGKGNPQKIYHVALGPEYVAYVPQEQQAVNAAMGYQPVQPAAPQYVQPQQPVAPAAPPSQYVGQPVAPQYAQPVQPQYAPAAVAQPVAVAPQPVAPQPVAPQAPVQPVQVAQQPQPVASAAVAALDAIAAQGAPQPPAQPVAPAAAAGPVEVTQEHLQAYKTITAAGIDPQTAIATLAQRIGAGPEFIQAMTAQVIPGA